MPLVGGRGWGELVVVSVGLAYHIFKLGNIARAFVMLLAQYRYYSF